MPLDRKYSKVAIISSTEVKGREEVCGARNMPIDVREREDGVGAAWPPGRSICRCLNDCQGDGIKGESSGVVAECQPISAVMIGQQPDV